MKFETQFSRRSFMRHFAGCAALAAIPAGNPLLAQASPAGSLSFLHTHTGEALTVDHCCAGQYPAAVLDGLSTFLRDFRSGERHAIDPALLDSLFALQSRADRALTFEVISGYRSPQTNALMHQKSEGVAAHSLHMEGRAIDVRASGYPTTTLRDHALALAAGGVGYYRGSDFVHIDTGRFRTWAG